MKLLTSFSFCLQYWVKYVYSLVCIPRQECCFVMSWFFISFPLSNENIELETVCSLNVPFLSLVREISMYTDNFISMVCSTVERCTRCYGSKRKCFLLSEDAKDWGYMSMHNLKGWPGAYSFEREIQEGYQAGLLGSFIGTKQGSILCQKHVHWK